MFKSAKSLLGLAVVSAILAGLCYVWWGRLIVGTFAQCVGGAPGVGVDCAHDAPITAALTFATLTVAFLIAAGIRAVANRSADRRVA